jgi:hypothetical protein
VGGSSSWPTGCGRCGRFCCESAPIGLGSISVRSGRGGSWTSDGPGDEFAPGADEEGPPDDRVPPTVAPELIPGEGQGLVGSLEVLNDTSRLSTRKSYGFRKGKVEKPALLHNLGQLPGPKRTYSFS